MVWFGFICVLFSHHFRVVVAIMEHRIQVGNICIVVVHCCRFVYVKFRTMHTFSNACTRAQKHSNNACDEMCVFDNCHVILWRALFVCSARVCVCACACGENVSRFIANVLQAHFSTQQCICRRTLDKCLKSVMFVF